MWHALGQRSSRGPRDRPESYRNGNTSIIRGPVGALASKNIYTSYASMAAQSMYYAERGRGVPGHCCSV